MNYQRIYNEFIADRKAKAAAISGYSEKHHILPRALGGGDDQDNLVRLTPEDHVHAHLLLAKIHGGMMWLAVRYACFSRGAALHSIPTRRMIRAAAFAMEHGRASHSEQTREQISEASRRNWSDPEYRARMVQIASDPDFKARLSASHKTRPPATVDTRAKMSAALMGHTVSEETRAKISAARSGKTHSVESRLKIGAASKGRPKSAETVEKHRVASTGKRHTEAAREKNRLATLEMWSRPGMRDRVAEGNRGQKRSAESRAKMSKSANEKFARAAMSNPDGAMFSQEVRAKLSASIGAYSNTPEGREAKRRASAAACTAEVLARRTATLKASHDLRKQYAAAIGHNGKYTEIKLADAKAWALAG